MKTTGAGNARGNGTRYQEIRVNRKKKAKHKQFEKIRRKTKK